MGARVYCTQCGRGATLTMIGKLPECRVCGPTEWRAGDNPNDLKYPYLLNRNDKQFLKSIRIQGEEPME